LIVRFFNLPFEIRRIIYGHAVTLDFVLDIRFLDACLEDCSLTKMPSLVRDNSALRAKLFHIMLEVNAVQLSDLIICTQSIARFEREHALMNSDGGFKRVHHAVIGPYLDTRTPFLKDDMERLARCTRLQSLTLFQNICAPATQNKKDLSAMEKVAQVLIKGARFKSLTLLCYGGDKAAKKFVGSYTEQFYQKLVSTAKDFGSTVKVRLSFSTRV
jgi:hypothetical protein